ncbi:hypothetical protein FEM03_09725 [Phragmitibacter flavus]|uniref:Peptidase C39 domain-containing protein n=1 Tax=Phragmitibacter flavus TaxID=2576071 RepID=A0A5R8KFS9_9BACT|nr:C39 family peptidase [Phragmitibacter flavus]TLD71174.1 hypothetical protein FEM03_09725 [Phragmitibacter flavus]
MMILMRTQALMLAGVCVLQTACSSGNSSGDTTVRREWNSWRELRDLNVVKQQMDYSCGAAALATLMKYYFDDEVSEAELLRDIFLHLTPAELKNREQEGLSLLDLQNAAERRGYQAVGVQLPFESIGELGGPVLVHLETKDYRHYAVLRGTAGDRVFLADPSRGNIRIPMDRFSKQWTTVALVLGKSGFGLPADHALAVKVGSEVRPEVLAAKKALNGVPVAGSAVF